MSVKLLTENHLEFLSLNEDYTGLSESVLVKMPHCWKSHATTQLFPCYSAERGSHCTTKDGIVIQINQTYEITSKCERCKCTQQGPGQVSLGCCG